MKRKLLLSFFLFVGYTTFAQETYIPDDNFEAFLEANSMGNGIANDDQVTTANISSITTLDVSNQSINDLTGIEAFQSLSILNFDSNSVSSIDLSNNIALTDLSAVSNSLTTLNLTTNINLLRVDVADNDLTSFDFRNGNNGFIQTFRASANYGLYCIAVDDVDLSSLVLWTVDSYTSFDENCGTSYIADASFEAALENKNIGNGIIGDNYVYTVRIENTSTLDISGENVNSLAGIELFQNLSVLTANNNTISSVDLSSNVGLAELYLISNDLTSLDLTANTNLLKVDVADNELTSFDFRNGNNGAIQTFRAIANYQLLCITVDDSSLSSLSLWNIDSATSFGEDCNWTNIIDNNFENYLETHDADGNSVSLGDPNSMGNGIAGDNYVITAKIASVTSLDISANFIADITGIEDFATLETLDFSNNGVGNFDLSNNVALKELNCASNGMGSIDVSANVNLETLDASTNGLTTIDISTLTKLKELYLYDNDLTDIDFGSIASLEIIDVKNNDIDILAIALQTGLTYLDCANNNRIGLIYFENYPDLEYIDCSYTNLGGMYLAVNTKLETLIIEGMSGFDLDLSNQVALTSFSARYSDLTSLNMKNGNNANVTIFDARDNEISCILVDNPTASYLSAWQKDTTTAFSVDCIQTTISDANFETYLETHDADGNSVSVGDATSMGNGIANDGFVATSRISSVTTLDISNAMVSDIIGIEDFTALEILNISTNAVDDDFDLSSNTNLKELYGASNAFGTITIPAAINLEVLDLSDNNITNLDISSQTNLKNLNFAGNSNLNITDFSPFVNLEHLNCNEMILTSLDLSNNTLLKTLSIDYMSGFDVDLSNNTALTSFSARFSDLTSLNIKNGNNANVTTFDARSNELACIQVDDATASYLTTWLKDNSASFEEDCGETSIPDIDFEYHLETHDANGNVVSIGSGNSMGNGIEDDGKVLTARIKDVTTLNISGNSIGELDGLEAFESLEILDCSENNFNDFDFSQLPELKELYIHDVFFAVLDLSQNPKIEKLIYNDANATSLNLGANTVITELNIGGNNISGLDIVYTTLEILNIADNYQLSTIDVRSLTNLKNFNANGANLQGLDVSQNLLLETLAIDEASGFYLDLSNNTALTSFSARNSDMSGINIQNGNNANITLFDTELNSSTLNCIQVDDPNASYLNTWDVDSNVIFSLDCSETSIPDDNFENYLETHNANGDTVSVGDATSMGNGIANDNTVYTSRIESVIELDISGLTISDAIGIEDFIALQNLNCFNNSLSSIDLSQNAALQIIAIGRNNLTSLDLSQNTALTFVSCIRNQITSLDVSQNTMLESLYCSNNQINNLDVTNNPVLKNLSCYSNSLGSLDVTNLPLLENLDCVDNDLTSLDLSQNLELLELQAYENELISLDVSNNLKLVELFVESNQITSLDLSKNVLIEDVSCAFNQLTYLNLRNGNNTNFNNNDFDIRNNPGLTCVTVDDITYADANFTRKDVQTEFKLFCSETFVPDDNFEAYLETHKNGGGVVPLGDPLSMGNGIANDNLVGTEKVQTIKNLSVHQQGIADFTGLEAFISLETISAHSNTTSNLDLTANVNLTEAYLSNMGLTTINVSRLSALYRLNVRENALTDIDVSSNVALRILNLDSNNFSSVNISTNTALTDFRIRHNTVSTLDISNNTNLTQLYIDNNSIATLNVANNVLLETLSCGENEFVTIDISALTNLNDLTIGDTPTLTALDVSNNLKLEVIFVDNNTLLTSLDLSNHTKLVEVYTNNTAITTLDFSNSPDIVYIECTNGQLTSLNLKNGNNSSSIELYATGNPNLLCIQVDDASGSYLTSWEKDNTAVFGEDCNWTYVPDDIFETYLEDSGYGNGIANDNYVSTEAVKVVTNLTLSNLTIADFTGLEAFTDLERFSTSNSTATDLDFTSNTKLTRIRCSDMDLNSIDVTGLTALTELYLYKCDLNSIDISTNIALDDLAVSENNLTSLDVSNNVLLEVIQFHENNLSSIDISMLDKLERLQCSHNAITNLNLENNLALTYLSMGRNPVDELDISMLSNLETLNAYELNITSLDISNNASLTDLLLNLNANLSYLNLRNGNNDLIEDMDATDNPSLTCIEVDDPTAAYLSASYWEKDDTASYAKYCKLTYVPDDNFEYYLETHRENTGGTTIGNDNSLGNGVMDDYVPTEKIENLPILFIQNQGITDFTGLEEFTALERFNGYGNPVNGHLDLTANINLTQAYCWEMGLTSIDLTGLATLSQLALANNDLSSLDVITNTIVETIDVENNNLSSLNVTNNPNITGLNYAENAIETIDLSQNTNLVTLEAWDNGIETINLQSNTLIETIEIGNNPLTSIDVSAFPNLVNLVINNTNIDAVDITNNPNMSKLVCNDTGVTALDLSNNTRMYILDVHNNAITELDLGSLTSLNQFNGSNNQLTTLNLRNSNNEDMASVDITDNPNLICIEVDDPNASYLSSWSKDDTASFAEYCRLTYVPDDEFEAFLESQGYGNGIENDDYVYTGLVEVSEGIIFQNKTAVTDMIGIEDFRDAWYFVIRNNPNLTSVDLSKNTKLTTLSLANNNLSSLDLSNNTLLERVLVNDNNLGSIDVTMMPNLRNLDCSNTGITSIDLTQNPSLSTIRIGDNELNQYLDLSAYSNLVHLYVANAGITGLDMTNGNNYFTTAFDATGNPDLTCIRVDDVNEDLSLWNFDDTASLSEDCGAKITPFVVLQGAFTNPNSGEESLMRDDLRVAGLIPTTSPYTDALTFDSSVLNTSGSNAVVDWIEVQLRDKNDSSILIESRSALLLRNGAVVDVDGISDVNFSSNTGSYYVVVNHRNHLGIMTNQAQTIGFNSGSFLYLNDDPSEVKGGTNAVIDMGNGMYATISGDYDGNGQVQNSDINSVVPLLGGSGYTNADMDMNGEIQNTDINTIVNPNIGKGEQF